MENALENEAMECAAKMPFLYAIKSQLIKINTLTLCNLFFFFLHPLYLSVVISRFRARTTKKKM